MARIVPVIALLSNGAVRADDGALVEAPKIWDETELAEWGLPVAAIKAKQQYISEAAYYASPVDNLRTYPVYHPDYEPPGYWEDLITREPRQLVVPGKARTRREWIQLGKRVFEELDQAGVRTNDPRALAYLRDRDALRQDDTTVAADGTIPAFRWVVEEKGHVSLGLTECAGCHLRLTEKGKLIYGAPGNLQGGGAALASLLLGFRKRYYAAQPITKGEEAYYNYHVPWLEDDVHAKMRWMPGSEIDRTVSESIVPGTFPRANGSPYWTTKIPDLRGVKKHAYLDATATHRNRGPEDIARYAALVAFADTSIFGRYHTLPHDHPRPLFRVPDDALFALGMYLYSLEPLPNPKAAEADAKVVARGKRVFRKQNCCRCHTGPHLGGELLTPAEGFHVPPDYHEELNIREECAMTDPNLAMNTRKATGLYKVPSLRGLWYRGLFGHSGSCASLEDWFGTNRLKQTYVPTGWKGPDVQQRSVPGHRYGLDLSDDDEEALISFLRTL